MSGGSSGTELGFRADYWRGQDALPGRASDYHVDLMRFRLIQWGALEEPHIGQRWPSPRFISCSVIGWGPSRKNVALGQKLSWIWKVLESGAVSSLEVGPELPTSVSTAKAQLLIDTPFRHDRQTHFSKPS